MIWHSCNTKLSFAAITAWQWCDLWLCRAGAQASTGRPVFVRPELPRRAELKDGPLARAAANAAAAAAQRPAMPAAAQPASRTQEADGQPGNVGRLKQEYEERAAVGSSAALPAHKACLLSIIFQSPCISIKARLFQPTQPWASVRRTTIPWRVHPVSLQSSLFDYTTRLGPHILAGEWRS